MPLICAVTGTGIPSVTLTMASIKSWFLHSLSFYKISFSKAVRSSKLHGEYQNMKHEAIVFDMYVKKRIVLNIHISDF